MDTIKGLALIATFVGVLIIVAMWVSLWENVWSASVEPVRGAIYDTRLNRLELEKFKAPGGCEPSLSPIPRSSEQIYA